MPARAHSWRATDRLPFSALSHRSRIPLPGPVAPDRAIPAPPESPYGYLGGDRLVAATPEALVERCRRSAPRLVWTPEHPDLVPPETLPWLRGAVARYYGQRIIGLTVLWPLVCARPIVADTNHSFDGSARGVVLLSITALFAWNVGFELRARARVLRGSPRSAIAVWSNGSKPLGAFAVTAVVAVACAVSAAIGLDASVAFGGAVDPARWLQEPWRLLTAGLVHVDAVHVALGVGTVLIVGMVLEPAIGTRRIIAGFLLSTVAAGAVAGPFADDPLAAGGLPSVSLAGYCAALVCLHPRLRFARLTVVKWTPVIAPLVWFLGARYQPPALPIVALLLGVALGALDARRRIEVFPATGDRHRQDERAEAAPLSV